MKNNIFISLLIIKFATYKTNLEGGLLVKLLLAINSKYSYFRTTLIQTMDRILQMNTTLKENNPRFYSSYAWGWIQTLQHHNVLDVINGVLRWPEQKLSFVSKAVDYAVFGHEVC